MVGHCRHFGVEGWRRHWDLLTICIFPGKSWGYFCGCARGHSKGNSFRETAFFWGEVRILEWWYVYVYLYHFLAIHVIDHDLSTIEAMTYQQIPNPCGLKLRIYEGKDGTGCWRVVHVIAVVYRCWQTIRKDLNPLLNVVLVRETFQKRP